MARKRNQHDTPDFYARKAKTEGFNARSVYKLQEIHKKYLPLHKATRILDLGAAPGSWTQYLQKILPSHARITSVDIQALSIAIYDVPKVLYMQGDITNTHTIAELIALGPFDMVISDAAPSTTGNRTVDTAQSELIVTAVFTIATQTLTENGYMLAKIFQGSGITETISNIKTYFKHVSRYKPKAVRTSSFEEYLICY